MPDQKDISTEAGSEQPIPIPPRKEIKTKSQMRTWWLKTACMLALVVLSVVMLFTLSKYVTGGETAQLTFSELIKVIDYPLFALLLGILLLYIFVESGKYSYMLKVSTGKFHFRTALKTMFVGKYYDGITPLSTGGQPFQIYYLHKKNIPRGAATAIPIIRYIVSIIILTALSITLLILTPRFVPEKTATNVVLIIAWISLAINVLFPATIIFFSVFPNLSKRIIAGIVNLLFKLHIVKRKYEVTKKFVRELTEYSKTIKAFIKHIWKYIPLIILSVMESLLFVTIPFFIVIAIADVTPTYELLIQIACLVIVSRYTALLIPTPGNTGAMEATSSIVFSTIANIGSVIGWVVLVWRFATYYVYILSGIGINIFEIARSAIRNKRKDYLDGE